MRHGGGSQQAVNHWDVAHMVCSPPKFGNHVVDGQYPTGEPQSSLFEPAFQNDGLLRVTPPNPLNASAQLTKHQYAKEYVSFLHSCVPSRHVGITAVALA